MRRALAYVLVRHRSNWTLLGRFGMVGGSGVLVNMLVLFAAKKLGPFHGSVLAHLPGTSYNIRWYHLYFTLAFLVANLYNFQLNRTWTFRSARHARWIHGSAASRVRGPRRRQPARRPTPRCHSRPHSTTAAGFETGPTGRT